MTLLSFRVKQYLLYLSDRLLPVILFLWNPCFPGLQVTDILSLIIAEFSSEELLSLVGVAVAACQKYTGEKPQGVSKWFKVDVGHIVWSQTRKGHF